MNNADYQDLYKKAGEMSERELRDVVFRFIVIAEISPDELKTAALLRGLTPVKI